MKYAIAWRNDPYGRQASYVAQVPGEDGPGWGYVGQYEKARVLNEYWQRRFRRDMERVGSKAGFAEGPAPLPKPRRVRVAKPIATTEEPKMAYKYGNWHRPIGAFTVPKGWTGVEKHPAFKQFGVVVYDRELTPDEVRSYELTPLVPSSVIAEAIAAPLREYASEYIEDATEHPKDFEVAVGQAFDRLELYPSDRKEFDREEFAKLVLAKLKRPAGGKKRHGGGSLAKDIVALKKALKG